MVQYGDILYQSFVNALEVEFLNIIGKGATRTVYEIPNTDMVLKVEKPGINYFGEFVDYFQNISEARNTEDLNKEGFKSITPEIYYADYERLLMKRYITLSDIIKSKDEEIFDREELFHKKCVGLMWYEFGNQTLVNRVLNNHGTIDELNRISGFRRLIEVMTFILLEDLASIEQCIKFIDTVIDAARNDNDDVNQILICSDLRIENLGLYENRLILIDLGLM